MFDPAITNNVGAVVMGALFLWYMNKRDNAFNATITAFATEVKKLGHVIESLEKRLKSIEVERASRAV